MRGEKGFALVLTLLVTALLLALCAEFVNEVYVDTTLSRNFVSGQQASLLASSGIEGGIALLLNSPNQAYTSLADPWAKPLHMEDEQGGVTITIEEESGKLNLNNIVVRGGTLAPNNFYQLSALNLLRKLKLSTDLCDALVDWLDKDDVPQPGGAESSFYGTLKPPYKAKNYSLDTVEELGLVKGFSGDVVRQLQPFVTVYEDIPNATATPVNVNTAPKEVLASLQYGATAITDQMADAIIDYRKTTPFQNKGELGKVSGISSAVATGLATYIAVKGIVFHIRSEARVRDARRVVEAVVRLTGSGATKLYWREY